MEVTDKHLRMSEKAAPFFKDHEIKEGDYFGGRHHTCTNTVFWKNTGLSNWEDVMKTGSNELLYDRSNRDGDPNYTGNCGHKAYDGIFPILRPDELFEMLNGFNGGYFTTNFVKRWNFKNPLEMMANIVSCSNLNHIRYFNTFDSIEEYILAFFMLEVNSLVWNDKDEMWVPNNDWKEVENWKPGY